MFELLRDSILVLALLGVTYGVALQYFDSVDEMHTAGGSPSVEAPTGLGGFIRHLRMFFTWDFGRSSGGRASDGQRYMRTVQGWTIIFFSSLLSVVVTFANLMVGFFRLVA